MPKTRTIAKPTKPKKKFVREKRKQAAVKASNTKMRNWRKMVKSILILDCTPKKDMMSEGSFLNELIDFINSKPSGPLIKKRFETICNRQDFLDVLCGAQEGVIHISAHGKNSKTKGPIIHLASGAQIQVSELKDMWKKTKNTPKLVFLSACEAGQEALAMAFYENGVRYFVAPEKTVWWYDAATFLTIFYRLLLVEKKKTPWMAFKSTKSIVKKIFPKFSGNWRYFEDGKEFVI